MTHINKPFLALVLLGFYFSIAGIFSDVAFIKDTQMVDYYVYGRILFGVLNFIILILHFKKVTLEKLVIAYLVTMMVYSIHGQIFVPCYYLGYIEVLLFVGLFFPIDKKIYRTIAVTSALIMIGVLIEGPSSYSTDPLLVSKFKYDSIMAVLIMTICSVVGHAYITLTRKEKDLLYNKFIDIGKNSAFILHDFKGMMSTPILYAKILSENINNKNYDKATKNLEKLNNDLEEIEKYVKEINKLTLPNKGERRETFKLSSTVDSVQILLNKYMDNVSLKLDRDGEITSDPSLLLKILYNLTVNSINEFKVSGKENGVITLELKDNCIVYKDNGNGYSPELLKKLNSQQLTIESQTGNSGLGLQIVVGIASELGIRLKFFNDNGACVKISL